MKKILLSLVSLFIFSPAAYSVPFEPQVLKSYESSKNTRDLVRLKISAASESDKALNKLDIDHIIVCSKKECYRAEVTEQTRDGSVDNAIVLADVSIPRVTLESIHFKSKRNGNIIDGDLKLNKKLDLAGNYYGGEIFGTFREIDANSKGLNKVVFATSTLIQEDITTLHYVPQFSLTAQLKHGVTIDIPARALLEPTIFTVSVDDTGRKYPSVDIYPYLSLLKSASVKATPLSILNKERETDMVGKPTEVPPPVVPVNFLRRSSGEAGTKPISKMGTVRSYDFENPGDPQVSRAEDEASISAYGQCASLFDSAANRDVIIATAMSNPYGVVNINWCENFPPYVHIVYFYGGNARTAFQFPNITSPRPDSPGSWQNLTRIDQLTSKSIAAINGFTWEGDLGAFSGGFGLAKGFVRTEGQCLGDNREGGGCLGGTGVAGLLNT